MNISFHKPCKLSRIQLWDIMTCACVSCSIDTHLDAFETTFPFYWTLNEEEEQYETVIYLTGLQVQYLLILWAIRHLAELSLWQFPSISSEHFIFQRLSGPGQRVAIIKSKQKQRGERERDGWQPQTYWIGTTTIVTSLLIRKPALVQDLNAEYLLLIVGSNFVKKKSILEN